MKTLENITKETIKTIIKNGKSFLAVSSFYDTGKIKIFKVFKISMVSYVFLNYDLDISVREKTNIRKRIPIDGYIDDEINTLFFNIGEAVNKHPIDFVFLELETKEDCETKKLLKMGFEDVLRSLFEKGFFPKKYLELEEGNK